VEYALRAPSSKGDPDAAFRLLMLLEETYEGIVRPFDPSTRLLGAENRGSVTCFLDALLFGMFARLDSFEAMLYENFEDPQRRKLAGFLRLWVNLLRSGRLITTDVTKHLQDALAECGWRDAANLRQQDPSEAFGFITGQLELPLLTLKMDLFHTGKEDPADDHKFVNERLLEVAIPEEPSEGNSVITLEDCLEHYFNNRIEVKRHMEQQRRNTLQGSKVEDELKAFDSANKPESGLHVEVAEVCDTPIASTPIAEAPSQLKSPTDKLRPGSGRKRADSIFSQRKVTIEGVDPNKAVFDDSKLPQDDRLRRVSTTRTEVLMPAWQFFKLLPWYTDHMPTSDAQVAAHFSRKRPVLGVALKRYSYTNEGASRRRDTFVDIPLEIAVPNFVSDDSMRDEGPLVGNFRLVLQSVICHRGVSVHSGHYICLSRGSAPNAARKSTSERRESNSSTADFEDPWMRFDDLAKERVSYVNIHDALREETPYLLFYQVQPIGEDGHAIHDLPSYAEATSRSQSDAMPFEKSASIDDIFENDVALQNAFPRSTETTDFGASSARNSLDINTRLNSRGRTSRDQRRSSVAFEGSSVGGSVAGSIGTATTASVPATPVEEKGNAFLSVAKNLGTRKTSRPSRSRPTSSGPGNSEKEREKEASRFSLNMSKLSLRMSRVENNNAAASSSGNGGGSNSNSPLSATQSSELVAPELPYDRDDGSAPPPSYVPSVPASEDGYNDTASKEAAASPVKSPPAAVMTGGKGKKEKEGKKKHGHSHSHGKSGHEERDCVVM
jgi:hypothetical protein